VKRPIALLVVAATMLLGYVVAGSPAGASVFPGTNGKIEFAE
jgi:hypothetical protein